IGRAIASPWPSTQVTVLATSTSQAQNKRSSESQNVCGTEETLGKVETQICPKKGCIASEEVHWSPPYESSYAEEAVGYYEIFFQAEDGIRDWSVTGVQTCALPI